MMALIGNILWLIFGGFLSGIGYILGGFVMCLTIVGIPFGIQSMKLGVATFAPFGREVVEREDAGGCLRFGFDIIWLIFFGWEIRPRPPDPRRAARHHDHRHTLRLAAPQADPDVASAPRPRSPQSGSIGPRLDSPSINRRTTAGVAWP